MANSIKKQMDAIDRQEKDLRNVREVIKSECSHTKNGDLDIVPKQNRQNGELKYICRKCKKELDLKKIDEDTLTNACDIIDRAIDVIKLSLDTNREDEEKILRKMAKTQYRVRNDIKKFYAASLKKNRNGSGKNNRNDTNSGGAWNKPTINGR